MDLSALDNVLGGDKTTTTKKKVAPVSNSGASRLSGLDNILGQKTAEQIKPVEGTYKVDKTGAFKDSAGNNFTVSAPKIEGDGSTISKGVPDARKPDSLLARVGRLVLPHGVETAFGISEEQRKPPEMTTADNVRLTGSAATAEMANKNPEKVSINEYIRRGLSFGNELDPTNLVKGYKSDVSVTDLPEPTTVPQKLAQVAGSLITMSLAQPLIEAGVSSIIGSSVSGAKFLETLKTASGARPWTVGYGLKVLESAGTGGLFGLITNNKQSVAKNVIDTAGTFAAFTALVYPVAQFFKPIIQSVGKTEITNPNLKRILNDPDVQNPIISKTLWFKNPKDPNQLLKVTANGMEFTSKPAGEIVEGGVNIKDVPALTSIDVEAFQTKPSVYQNLKNWINGKKAKNMPFSVTDTIPKDAVPVDVNVAESPKAEAYKSAITDLENAKPSEVRNSLISLENELNASRAIPNPTDQTALIAKINATRDAFNAYNNANKEVVLTVPSKNNEVPAVSIEIVPYDDGKYSVSADANIGNSGFSYPFTGAYPSREAAITAGRMEVRKFIAREGGERATDIEQKQLSQIEKALDNMTSKSEKLPVEIKAKTENAPLAEPNIQDYKPIYHGTPANFEKFDTNISEGGATWFTDSRKEITSGKVGAVQKKGEKLNIMTRYIKPDIKLATPEQADKLYTDQLIAEGYRGVKYPADNDYFNHEWTKLFFPNEDTITQSELEKIIKKEPKKPRFAKPQKEIVKEAVSGAPKSIKQVAEETKILEPNVRRILGVGAKDGTFERVDNGVYVLKNAGKEIAYVEANDALTALTRLAKEGKSYNSVILDPAYFSRALIGKNRGIKKWEFILPDEFAKVMKQVGNLVNDKAQVYLMLSGARTAQPDMTKYVQGATDAGFKVVGEGTYTKTFKDGKPVTNVRGVTAAAERLILMSKSGEVVKGEIPVNLNFRFIRPSIAKSYQTEKPAELMKALIEQSTLKGESVLDPFAGSGVTGAEAIKSERVPTLIEKKPEVVENVIKPRVREAVKQVDTLNAEMQPLKAEIGLGEDDKGMLTTKELEANGKAVEILKEEISQVSKQFIGYQNGLYLEPSTEKRPIINDKKVNVGKTKPLLTKTAVINLLKNSPDFKKNPVLTVATKKVYSEPDQKVLIFTGQKGNFSIRASAFGLLEKNLVDGQTIRINPESFKAVNASGQDRLRVNEYTRGAKQRGSFASMDKFRETIEPTERVIDNVNPIEFPELVRLARQLMGDFPKIKLPRFRPSLGGRPNGFFVPTGNGSITINPELFKEGNEQQVAKTLAHEIGHLMDYLPDKTMARGNVMGRLAVLKNFRADFFPDAGVTRSNPEMVRELWALSKYWKPVDEETAPANFIAYRKEPPELYADFISVLFNDPKLAQDMAPESYNTFFKRLDQKPEVKQAYFELQDLLAGSTEDLMKARQADVRAGFARGEDLQAGFAAKRKAAVTKFWERLRQQLDDVNYPVLKKQAEAEAAGHVFTEDESPRFALQEQSMADNENFVLVDEIDKNIIKPIEKAGMIVEDLGEYLLLDRIVNERVNIANPFGFNTKNAPKQMDFLKKTVGENNFALLQEKVQAFHDLVYKSVEEAVRVGSYNKEIFETKIKPNKNHYASFQVVDYMQDYMPATVKGQVGTLKEVANPFVSTLLKTIALNRLNAFQRAKNTTIAMLKDQYPTEITPSKTITDGKITKFKIDKDPNRMVVLEDGKLQGYDVDPYIAQTFERSKVGDLNMIVSLIDKFNNKLFKPLVTTYNLGFALAFNPIRDFKRNYKLIPNANIIPITLGKEGIKFPTAGNILAAYIKSLPSAVRYNKGKLDEFTKSLVESKAINAPMSDYNFDAREDEFGNILKKYGLIAEDIPWDNKTIEFVRKKLLKPVVKVLEGIRFVANTFEVISKIAGAKVRIAGGESGKQLAYNVRNYTGTPNYKVRGNQTRTTNAIFVFSNIAKEGLKSDFKVATDPKTAFGYWFKTVKIDLLPKFLMFLATTGVLGVGIKKWFDKVSEYDKSNYIIIPLGTTDSDKAVYMRIPHDESGRLVSSAFWKMANFIKDGKSDELQDIFAIGAGQLPSFTPIISVVSNWGQYLSGRNPYDAFHGRTLIDDTTWQAGGGAALKKMVQWTTNNLGFTKFATYDTSKNTGVETFMQTAPFFSSVFKISDYGETEKLKTLGAEVKQEKAKQTLLERDVVKKYIDQASKDGTLSLFSVSKYGNQAVKEILGHMPKNKDEQDHADRIIQKFKLATKRELVNDNRYTSIIDTNSNDEKKALLKSIKDESTKEEYDKIKNDLLQLKIVTPALLYSVK